MCISTKTSVLITVTQREVLTPALCSGGGNAGSTAAPASDESIRNSNIISRSTHYCISNTDNLCCFMWCFLSSLSLYNPNKLSDNRVAVGFIRLLKNEK